VRVFFLYKQKAETNKNADKKKGKNSLETSVRNIQKNIYIYKKKKTFSFFFLCEINYEEFELYLFVQKKKID
jgi:hypothetical protein